MNKLKQINKTWNEVKIIANIIVYSRSYSSQEVKSKKKCTIEIVIGGFSSFTLGSR